MSGYNGFPMRCAALVFVVFATVDGWSAGARADTVYRCGLKNGAPWYTMNVRPRGAKCVPVQGRTSPEPRVPGARCTVQRYREASFFRCERDGIVWFFNRNRVAESGGDRGLPARGDGAKRPGGMAPEAMSDPEGRREADLDAIVVRAAEANGVPEALIRAVIHVESRFRSDAVSPAGAQGLMQLMPVTAEALAVEDPFDPEQNVLAGARLLRKLADRFRGDLERTVAAYYSGPSAVERAGGIPDESCAAYVRNVLDQYRRFAEPR